jgi:hypothetical protein
VSLLNAGDGEFVVIYELRATPTATDVNFGEKDTVFATPTEADVTSGEKDTVFAMRVSVEL